MIPPSRYFKDPQAIINIFGRKAYDALNQLLNPCCTNGGIVVGLQSFTGFQTVNTQQAYTPVIGIAGKQVQMVYLDGGLLPPTEWTYNSGTDTITFTQPINSIMWVQGMYL